MALYNIGLWTRNEIVEKAALEVYGNEAKIYQFDGQTAKLEQFFTDPVLTEHKIFAADWSEINGNQEILTIIRDVFFANARIIRLLFFTDRKQPKPDHPLNIEGTHFIPLSDDKFNELINHFKDIKSILDFSWLYLKTNDLTNLKKDDQISSFLLDVFRITEAEMIDVQFLKTDGLQFASFWKEGTSPAPLVNLAAVEKLCKFNDACCTYLLDERDQKNLFGEAVLVNSRVALSSFSLDGIKGLIVYYFEESFPPDLLRTLCEAASRETVDFLIKEQMARLNKTLRELLELHEIKKGKVPFLKPILSGLKQFFNADGCAIIRLITNDEHSGNITEHSSFEKIYLERESSGISNFSASKSGFAKFCVSHRRALLINDLQSEIEPYHGNAYSFDLTDISPGKGELIKLNTFRNDETFEDETSLMYVPLICQDTDLPCGAIKVSSFSHDLSFSLHQLKNLNYLSKAVNTILQNLTVIERLEAEIANRNFQSRMEDEATKFFFYREIALGIFHQLANRLQRMNSSVLTLDMLSKAPPSVPKDLPSLIEPIKKELDESRDLIKITKQRGKELKPASDICLLIKDVVRPALEYAKKRAEEANKDAHKESPIKVESSLTSHEFLINVDKDLTKESMYNLINNAIYAITKNRSSKKEIKISVRVKDDGSRVMIRFEDSGIGIPSEDIPKLFTPFFTTKTDGTGLGLFFSKKLIESFDGSIYLARTIPNKETTFVIELPFVEE